jgi:hypothetical protein
MPETRTAAIATIEVAESDLEALRTALSWLRYVAKTPEATEEFAEVVNQETAESAANSINGMLSRIHPTD